MDLKNVVLVFNYDCPMYREDFVHRVGRTGRAKEKGLAITLVTEEDQEYSRELISVLQQSNIPVPSWLEEMHETFLQKVQRGEAVLIRNRN